MPRRAAAARTRSHNHEDLMFAKMMAMHHEQGIKMMDRELALGANPQLQQLARKMRAAQVRELRQLHEFVALAERRPG